jgi:hypothetical protein
MGAIQSFICRYNLTRIRAESQHDMDITTLFETLFDGKKKDSL